MTTPAAFRHGLRVRIARLDGPKGVLLRCERKTDGGIYWRVRLQSGAWVFPDDLIVDGRGDRVGVCGDCGLRFVNTGNELICDRCSAEIFGHASRASANSSPETPAAEPHARYHFGHYHRKTRR